MSKLATVRRSRVSVCGCDKCPQWTCQTTNGTCARRGLRLFYHIIGTYLYLLLYLILNARPRLLLVFVFYLPIIHTHCTGPQQVVAHAHTRSSESPKIIVNIIRRTVYTYVL